MRIEKADIEKGIVFTSKDSLPSECEPLYNDQPLLHDSFEFFFVKAGEVSWFIEHDMYPIAPYSLTIFNNEEIHKLHIRSNKRFVRMKLLFDPELIRRLEIEGYDPLACFVGRPKGKGNVIRLSNRQGEELMALFRKISDARAARLPESPFVELVALLELLAFANRLYANAPRRAADGPALPDKVARAVRYIDEHLEENLSLDTLSATLDINRYYLCRVFKKETGSTLHNYILFKRVSEAKRLLGDGLKPAQVCRLCGFGSMARFSASFRNVVGATPAAYAKSRDRPEA